MKIAIIAAYNEEDTIGSIVLKTKKHVDKVIVVDDGSRDKTAEVAQIAGAEVIQHIRNGGKGEALKTGFEAAESLHPDVVVCLDADAQHDPDDIPQVVAPILSGDAEMVIASRYINKEHTHKVPRYRRFGLWVLTTAMNLGSSVKITDTQSGFRAFSGDIIGNFNFGQTGLSIESEMIKDAHDNEITIKEVPISMRYDGLDTSTETPGKHGFGVLGFILKTVRDRRPLLYFGVSGAVLLIIGLVLGVYSLSSFSKGGQLPFGPSLAASMLILMGALGIFAGLILQSISTMIQGQKLLRNRSGAMYETKVQRQTPSSPHGGDLLLGNINYNKIQGLTALGNHGGAMLHGNINGNNIPGLTVLGNHGGAMLHGNINGNYIPGLTVLGNHGGAMLPGNINGNNILGPIALDNHGGAMLLGNIDGNEIPQLPVLSSRGGGIEAHDIDEQRISEPALSNNHHRATSLEDIDEKKIHM